MWLHIPLCYTDFLCNAKQHRKTAIVSIYLFRLLKKGYDIAVHKSQAKTGGRQIDLSERLKLIRKSDGKPLLAIMTNFVGYVSQNIRASLDFV